MKDSEIRKNIYIEILEYAQKTTEFTIEKLVKDLNLNPSEIDLLTRSRDSGLLICNIWKKKRWEDDSWTMSVEGRFRLLDYEQIQLNYKSLFWTKSIWIKAMILYLCVGLATIIY